MNILGISAYYHDSAACIVRDGSIIAASQEERFTRIRHDESFPVESIKYCMDESGLSSSDLDYIVFYDKPLLKFDRIFESYLAYAPNGFTSFKKSLPTWAKDKIFQKKNIENDLKRALGTGRDISDKIIFSDHHLSHASSAFFPSPFSEAAILTVDGVGEWATTTIGSGLNNQLRLDREIQFPHSVGLLYSAFTYYTGFKVNSGEYKLMGLAPYGNPVYVNLIKDKIVDLKSDGSFQLNMEYFEYCKGDKMVNHQFEALFGGQARTPESDICQKEMDIAASIQAVTEEIVSNLARSAKDLTGSKNLCMAGGVALNCVANGKLQRSGVFENIWIQPAAGDAGGAIGAALAVNHLMLNKNRIIFPNDAMQGAYLGPSYDTEVIRSKLEELGAVFYTYDLEQLCDIVTDQIIKGKAVGWHQGRMEFGPRALGNRSILADPRSPYIQKQLNIKVKQRESFRPFAPSILEEDCADWFNLKCKSPYMLLVAEVLDKHRTDNANSPRKKFGIDTINDIRSSIPSVTHVDYTARVQTVSKEINPIYHALLSEFKRKTGFPVLVNTSFNIRGEPIVNTPFDAYRCFMSTDIDLLVIGNTILYKNEQPIELAKSYTHDYELD